MRHHSLDAVPNSASFTMLSKFQPSEAPWKRTARWHLVVLEGDMLSFPHSNLKLSQISRLSDINIHEVHHNHLH